MRLASFALLSVCALLAVQVLAATASTAREEPEVKIVRQEMTREQVDMLYHASGAELFAEFCAACHAADGTGSAAAAKALGTTIPDLTLLSANAEDGKFPRLHVITALRCPIGTHIPTAHLETMPDWKNILEESRCGLAVQTFVVERLVDHLESIQK
jgi:hypothetical protein